MPTRYEVYEAVNSERNYQNEKWGDGHDLQHRRPEEWLVYMKVYLDAAFVQITMEPDETAIPKTLDTIRKITALGVAAMEQLGAPKR
jgi:hypothetical protein